MKSIVVLGVPRSGTTFISQYLAYIFKCDSLLSEPIRTLELFPNSTLEKNLTRILNDKNILLNDFKVDDLNRLQSCCIKETLRFHIKDDYPTEYWTSRINRSAQSNDILYNKIFLIIRNPASTIESILNRNSLNQDYPDFENDPFEYLNGWINNINKAFQYGLSRRLTIIKYEDFLGNKNIRPLPFYFKQKLTKDQLTTTKTYGIGDEKALGQYKGNKQKKYKLNNKMKEFIYVKLDKKLLDIYKDQI